MTEQELAQIVEQAEARKGWKLKGEQYGNAWLLNENRTNVEVSTEFDNAQFILDAIRAIPIQRDIIAQKDKEIAELREQLATMAIEKLGAEYISNLVIDALNETNSTPTEYAKDEKYEPYHERNRKRHENRQ